MIFLFLKARLVFGYSKDRPSRFRKWSVCCDRSTADQPSSTVSCRLTTVMQHVIGHVAYVHTCSVYMLYYMCVARLALYTCIEYIEKRIERREKREIRKKAAAVHYVLKCRETLRKKNKERERESVLARSIIPLSFFRLCTLFSLRRFVLYIDGYRRLHGVAVVVVDGGSRYHSRRRLTYYVIIPISTRVFLFSGGPTARSTHARICGNSARGAVWQHQRISHYRLKPAANLLPTKTLLLC